MSDMVKILVVEDEPEIREAMSDFISTMNMEPFSFDNAEDALNSARAQVYDLVITDMKLPGMDGIELSRRIKQINEETSIIVATAYGNIDSAMQAIDYGAEDYLLKPFGLDVLSHAINKVLEKKKLERENLEFQLELEEKVERRKSAISRAGKSFGESFYQTLYILGNAQECREIFTRGRTERMALLTYWTAYQLGWDDTEKANLLLGAPLSDVGKLAIPETILNKTTTLDNNEKEIIKSHVEGGINVISNLEHLVGAIPIIRHHHERIDGSGYPDGLKGDEIPRTARLTAICDSFDAMTHIRPWRSAKTWQEALQELLNNSGNIYDGDIVEDFVETVTDLELYRLINTKPAKSLYELALPILETLKK